MKKLLFLILTMAYCMAGKATTPTDSWVITKDGRMDCKQVCVRISKARILLQDGKKISIPLTQISSYSKDGKVFNKINLYRNGKPSNRMVFMELFKTRDGYNLYKYKRNDVEIPYACYYIYKGDQFYCALDESQEPNRIKSLFKYFGIHASLEFQYAQAF